MRRALLLSGGLDSAAIAWWMRPEVAIFVDYGQKSAAAEPRAAEAIAGACGIDLRVVGVDCSSLGAGQMSGQPQVEGAPSPEWWPFRNQMLVTMAASVALLNGVGELVIGTIAEDRTNGDGTPEFVAALDRLLRLQEGSVRLSAPAMELDAVELLARSGLPPDVAGWAHSCFVADKPCMKCRGCIKHMKTLEYSGRRWP